MRYGQLNEDYIATWFQRDDPGGPMWALNLMKYREQADYSDGRESTASGIEADNRYAPHGHLAAVGSRIVLVAPVVHHLVGDGWKWDRVAIAQYRDRMALVEMSSKPDFQKDEQHKEAGMEFTIVLASFPVDDAAVPPQVSAVRDGQLLLLQVVGDAAAEDLAAEVESTRIGRFWVENRVIGDDRSFAEARYDLVSPQVAEELSSRAYVTDATRYALIADPVVNDVARSLIDPTRVLF